MTDCILDTTTVIELLRQNSSVVQWYNGLGKQRTSITPVVWLETVQGARNNIERAQVIRFLRQFSIEHPTPGDNQWTMLQYAKYHLSYGMEWADVMIASVAIRLNVPVYTLNIKHYAPLPGVDARLPYR